MDVVASIEPKAHLILIPWNTNLRSSGYSGIPSWKIAGKGSNSVMTQNRTWALEATGSRDSLYIYDVVISLGCWKGESKSGALERK